MTDAPAYQVLARKYRPQTFADLIGQAAMVRTLGNAFAEGRIAQAFLLTGIRGTGKTTTARIIAKGLNCVGPDGAGGPTTDPCGLCAPCRAIAEGRHLDVIEMDAASHTGVADIREIIESAQYRAASARYKVYVIDEVHMLSTSAFNALLKTLEEPPPHVKFVFATTEVRKVPVTVLSRCQRFDLRRIEPETMLGHLADIAAREGVTVDRAALSLIVRAAEGSVRDALSLLDQAIAHGAGAPTAEAIRAMLGLADRGRVFDLFELILAGDAAGALAELARQYADGADPLMVLRDLAEVTHWTSLVRVSPGAADDPTVSPEERARGTALAARLPVPVLMRMWQMLLKAIEEVAHSPNAMMAAEMAVIRLTHVADLPTPGELVQALAADPPRAAPGRPAGPAGPGGGARAAGPPAGPPSAPAAAAAVARPGGAAAAPAPAPAPVPAPAPEAPPATALAPFARFEDVLSLIQAHRDVKLLVDVETHLRLARYAPGRIEFEPAPGAPADLAARLSARLGLWTGARWTVAVVPGGGAPSLAEARAAADAALMARAMAHPFVQKVLAAFPQARVAAVRSPEAQAAAAAAAALPAADPEADEGWDPFDRE